MRPRFSGQWCSHTRKPSGTDGVQSDGQGDEETEDKQAVPTGAQLKPGGPGRRRSAARTAAGLPGPGGSWPAAGLGSLPAGDGVSDDSSLPRPQLEGSGAPRRLGAAPARLSGTRAPRAPSLAPRRARAVSSPSRPRPARRAPPWPRPWREPRLPPSLCRAGSVPGAPLALREAGAAPAAGALFLREAAVAGQRSLGAQRG